MTQALAAADAGLDFSQFHQVFFEEAGDNLDSFEQLLLGIDVGAPADETLHAIFRCAHSVKGGAATFGFGDVTALTHAMETLLDRLRRHEIAPTTPMVDTLLQAGDVLRTLLRAHQEGGGEAPDTTALLQSLAAHARGEVPAPAPAVDSGARDYEMLVGPLAQASLVDDLLELFREVTGGGTLARAEPLEGQASGVVRLRLQTHSSESEVLDLCSFHVPREQIRLAPWSAPAPAASAAAPAAPAPAPAAATRRAAVPSETLRVSLEKVDQLINLMGELVINQAMLSQRAGTLEAGVRQQLMGGLADLERTTRDLQESVMSIRMIPMSDVFNRFPRMLRDLAARLNKQVELRTEGEATELDKGLIEKITDPLTHLVRNAVDHGFELPAERVAAGKPAQGTLTLSARHEGGCVVIEVRDDGRGLDRERLLAKARRSGMALPESMDDAEVFALIFAPGFSTAEAVTDISGRGVGMDVVRRNIQALGGTVELDSRLGHGTCVRVRLPLTLAIMDGMSVGVDGELYLLPLASVIESFQAQPGMLKTMPGRPRVVKVRGEWLPVLPLARCMDHPARAEGAPPAMLVLVQAEGRRIALEVDRLVGQQQVVVKNLELNYRRVPGVSGATIMGDGSVALILDVAALVRSTDGVVPSSSPARGRNTAQDPAAQAALH